MEPAQHDPVVSVRGATVGVFVNVVDFTPRGRGCAARNHASAITERDRAALVGVEDTVLGGDMGDAAVAGDAHALRGSGTPGMMCRFKRNARCRRWQKRGSGAGCEGFVINHHDKRGRGTPDRGRIFTRGRDHERGDERVMSFLRRGAGISYLERRARAPRWVFTTAIRITRTLLSRGSGIAWPTRRVRAARTACGTQPVCAVHAPISPSASAHARAFITG